MLLVVIALGLFAGWRNATAGALVVAYCVVMGAWWGWGITFPKLIGFMFDLTVIAVIYCKNPSFNCYPYCSLSAQFRSFWFDRTHWDRLVIVMFPIGWLSYVLPVSESVAWWTLFWCAIAQYLAAGGETLQASLSTRSAKADSTSDTPSSGFHFAPRRERRGYG